MAATTLKDNTPDFDGPSNAGSAHTDHDREEPEVDLLSPLTIRA
jgi:hypothetical protein